ncbi:MAG TPA: ABC transporter substrate-binding protein [bacterium]|nr:ABC transporter substrate-binding protein [bacterium]
MPRALTAGLVVVVIAIAVAAADRTAFSAPPALTSPVTVNDYVGGITSSAPQDFAADAEGIFARHKIKVNFVILEGTSQSVQAVAADRTGRAFVQGDLLDEMLLADKNPSAPALIGIAGNEPRNPVALIFLQSSGIKSPADLAGKTIGVPTGSLSEQYLDIFLQKQGIPKDKVTIQNIGFGALHPALMQKRVDAICEFARGLASLDIIAQQQGQKIASFLFGDYHLPSPLGAVVVQKSLLDKEPAVAAAIAASLNEGLRLCVINQEQCIKDFIAKNPGRDYDQTLAEWKVALKAQYGLDAATVQKLKPAQLGWFDPELVSATLPQLRTMFQISKIFTPTALYTNRFAEHP